MFQRRDCTHVAQVAFPPAVSTASTALSNTRTQPSPFATPSSRRSRAIPAPSTSQLSRPLRRNSSKAGTQRGRARRPPTLSNAHPPDTAALPRGSSPRYRARMAVEIIYRNQNAANPHADAGASSLVGGMLCIDGQRRFGKQQGGLISARHKILGFVAAMRHTSYNYEYPANPPQLRLPARLIALYGPLRPFETATLSRCNATAAVPRGSQTTPRCGGVVDTPLTGWPY